MVAEHCPQAPEGSQAGVGPPHSPSLPQARQGWVPVLQTGAVPLHCAFDVHGTHVPVVVKQAGVAPPQSLSPPQAWQRWVLPLHTGVVPEQSALATQRTHVPEDV